MSTRNLVSVVIPTFGRPEYLLRAIRSVTNQSHAFLEVLVIDDNDPNSAARRETSALVLREASVDSRIKYIQHPENRNGSAARNTGLSFAMGEFIAFLDDDDELLPDKIKRQVECLRLSPTYSAAYCLHSVFYKGNFLGSSKYCRSGNCAYDVLALRSEIHTSSMLLYTEVAKDLCGFDATFIRHQEYEFMVRFFNKYTMFCVPDILLHVNIDSSINRPDVDRLIAAKSHFFSKLSNYIQMYSTHEQRVVYKAHDIQLLRTCIKRFDRRWVLYLLRAKPSPNDFLVYFIPYVNKYSKLALMRTSSFLGGLADLLRGDKK